MPRARHTLPPRSDHGLARKMGVSLTLGMVVAVAVSMAGCATSIGPAAAPDLAGVTVEVSQPRTDIALDRIAIQVRNGGDAPLDLTRAELDGMALGAGLVWTGRPTSTVGAGQTLDLRVDLGTWDCAESGDAPLTVALELADGRTAVLPAGDPTRVILSLHELGCLDAAIATIVDLRSAALEAGDGPGSPATLVLTASPRGAAGTLVLDVVHSTTLVAPFDGVTGVPELPLGVTLGLGGPNEVRIPLVTNRCDVHALAEDKVGTRIPLDVTVSNADGTVTSGRIVLAADDALRTALHDFYADYCGFTS